MEKQIEFKTLLYLDYDKDYNTGTWRGYVTCADVPILSYTRKYSRYMHDRGEEDIIQEIEESFAEKLKSVFGDTEI